MQCKAHATACAVTTALLEFVAAVTRRVSLKLVCALRGRRSDLGGADIYGADFTNALVDRTQQMVCARGGYTAHML
jgi:hypothetical protein